LKLPFRRRKDFGFCLFALHVGGGFWKPPGTAAHEPIDEPADVLRRARLARQ
jgi:hypothetical protein